MIDTKPLPIAYKRISNNIAIDKTKLGLRNESSDSVLMETDSKKRKKKWTTKNRLPLKPLSHANCACSNMKLNTEVDEEKWERKGNMAAGFCALQIIRSIA